MLFRSAATTAVDGYLKATDFTIFNNKLTSTLTSANIFVGNGSNVATGVALSGDATISNAGNLQLVNTVVAGTSTKITYDAKGRVTAGAALAAADIPVLDAAKITTGVFPTARLGTGTQDATTYLRGDGTFVTTPLGSVTSVSSANGDITVATGTTTP